MSRIKKAFSTKAKIAYLTAAPNSLEYFLALTKGGANILEIGIPFSDPIADGPTIQRAMQASLEKGMSAKKVLDLVKELRPKTEAALILFTYLNPIQADLPNFLQKAKAAGADGLLIVDLPYEESGPLRAACKEYDLSLIAVAAPSTPMTRISLLSKQEGGFLYYACRKGTTGARSALPEGLIEKIKQLRPLCSLPIAIGFGIADPKSAKEALQIADGCVVGSYFVAAVEKGCTPKELERFTKEIFS